MVVFRLRLSYPAEWVHYRGRSLLGSAPSHDEILPSRFCDNTGMVKFILSAAAAALLSGCGLIYTSVRFPRAYRSATPNDVAASKDDPRVVGTACNHSLLYLVAWGRGGYAQAVEKAMARHPDKIMYDVKSDTEVNSILVGLYSTLCTTVTGRAGSPKFR